ncbi:hypothetical protein KCP74_03215 [Salmonella enterica subsp. enterica]|nr:hypothetical protein KCP74_03215 [Salmonella enterica subsp. enterica]
MILPIRGFGAGMDEGCLRYSRQIASAGLLDWSVILFSKIFARFVRGEARVG